MGQPLSKQLYELWPDGPLGSNADLFLPLPTFILCFIMYTVFPLRFNQEIRKVTEFVMLTL